jgi:hypothetical protein
MRILDNQEAQPDPLDLMQLLIPSLVFALSLTFSANANDAASQRKAVEAERKAATAERKAAEAERKAETVRRAEINSLKQEVQALQSQKTSGAKEYGDKVRAINAKKHVIRAKEAQ